MLGAWKHGIALLENGGAVRDKRTFSKNVTISGIAEVEVDTSGGELLLNGQEHGI